MGLGTSSFELGALRDRDLERTGERCERLGMRYTVDLLQIYHMHRSLEIGVWCTPYIFMQQYRYRGIIYIACAVSLFYIAGAYQRTFSV